MVTVLFQLSKLKSDLVPGLEKLSTEQSGKLQALENDLKKVCGCGVGVGMLESLDFCLNF